MNVQPIKADEEFREFWNSRHPSTLADFGFDPDDGEFFAFERRGDTGAIDSAAIFVPLRRDGLTLGHHVHLCSDLHGKLLFMWCNLVMIAVMDLPEVGLVACETQGKPELKKAERIAQALGFEPIFVESTGWIDWVWNSKAA
jgi:hypothetical protein